MDLSVTGCGECCHGAAMKTAVHRDHLGIFDSTFVAVATSDFQRSFVRLRSRIGEESVLHARNFAEATGKLFLQWDLIEI